VLDALGWETAMVELMGAIEIDANPGAKRIALPILTSRENARLLPALTRARWDLAVATELAESGTLHLFPVFAGRDLADFKFLDVCGAAAAYLGAEPDEFINRTVQQVFGITEECARLIRVYASVFNGGRETVHVAAGRNRTLGSSILHHVHRNAAGVSVLLTCPDAQARRADAEERFAAWQRLANAQPFVTVPAIRTISRLESQPT
jgi:hypothetical protein